MELRFDIDKALAAFGLNKASADGDQAANDGRTYAPRGKSMSPKPEAVITPAHVLSEAERTLRDWKQKAVNSAKEAAQREGRTPTIGDYYIACEQLAANNQEQMQREGISQWGPQVYANADHVQFDGFLIRKGEIEPSKAVQKLAMKNLYAKSIQQGNVGQRFSNADYFAAIRQVNDDLAANPDMAAKLEASLESEFDLDGDEIIGDLYKGIDHQANFKGTAFNNVTFHPAGTLTKYHTDGASFTDVTFDGMEEDKDFVRLTGCHQNTTFTNIRGGTIEVMDGAEVNRMDISGAHASLVIHNAEVSNLVATDAHVVRLEAGKGARINGAQFDGATIDMASQLAGSSWNDVRFTKANLGHVEMNGATLANVTFEGCSLGNLDLSGATISNLVINGEVITSPEQLKNHGICTNDKTTVKASQEFAQQVKQEDAIRKAKEAGLDKIVLDTKTPEEKAAALAMNEKKDPPKQEKPKVEKPKEAARAASNTEGLKLAVAGSSKSYYDQMNSDMNAAPKEAPKSPEALAALIGKDIAAAWKAAPAAEEQQPVAAKAPSKKQETGFDRSYFQRMSDTNGRA